MSIQKLARKNMSTSARVTVTFWPAVKLLKETD